MSGTSNQDSGQAFDQKAAQKKLTPKQAKFVNHILENPTASYTQAAKEAYPNATYATQRQIAMENMTKPSIVMALGKANDRVEQVLTTVVEEWGNSDDKGERTLAVNTAQWIHDKIHGKATQKIQATTSVVSINIDLSGQGQNTPIPQEVLDQLA